MNRHTEKKAKSHQHCELIIDEGPFMCRVLPDGRRDMEYTLSVTSICPPFVTERCFLTICFWPLLQKKGAKV